MAQFSPSGAQTHPAHLLLPHDRLHERQSQFEGTQPSEFIPLRQRWINPRSRRGFFAKGWRGTTDARGLIVSSFEKARLRVAGLASGSRVH